MVGNMVGVGGPTIRSGCLPISEYYIFAGFLLRRENLFLNRDFSPDPPKVFITWSNLFYSFILTGTSKKGPLNILHKHTVAQERSRKNHCTPELPNVQPLD